MINKKLSFFSKEIWLGEYSRKNLKREYIERAKDNETGKFVYRIKSFDSSNYIYFDSIIDVLNWVEESHKVKLKFYIGYGTFKDQVTNRNSFGPTYFKYVYLPRKIYYAYADRIEKVELYETTFPLVYIVPEKFGFFLKENNKFFWENSVIDKFDDPVSNTFIYLNLKVDYGNDFAIAFKEELNLELIPVKKFLEKIVDIHEYKNGN